MMGDGERLIGTLENVRDIQRKHFLTRSPH